MSDAPTFDIDLEAFWADPYPALAAMRSEVPICFVPQLDATLLTRRDDIHACEKNVAVFSSEQPGGLMNVLMGENMMRRDGDAHRRERFVYYPAISPKTVQRSWATEFAELTDQVLDRLDGRDSIDLVADYAAALSGEALRVMTGLTNVTAAEIDSWSQAMIDGIANYSGDSVVDSRCRAATAAIDAAIDERLPEVHSHPDPSLLTAMLCGDMPLESVRANIKLTISGGQNEPRDAIAGSVWAVLTHPEQLEMVKMQRASWLDVFEEYCRWISPIGMSPRRVAAPHEFGGVHFEPEDRAFFMFGSANRDERHFDDADTFIVARDATPNMTFGSGPHFCAGAAASRSLIAANALPRLFDRFPHLEIDQQTPTEFGGWAFRGPLKLQVRLR